MTDIVKDLRSEHPSDVGRWHRGQRAADEIERLRERLGPRGLEVIEIDGAGHYVNEKVKAEIERLRNALEAIRKATLKGDVCPDVAWFDQIETLHDFCERILSVVGEPMEDAAQEIERLQEAKRRALQVADERAKESVVLRKALTDILDANNDPYKIARAALDYGLPTADDVRGILGDVGEPM